MLVFGGVALVFGLVLLLLGGRLVLTGRNFSGVLGRGFTKSDDLRLKRAPAAFFRAMGTMVCIGGFFLIFIGAVFALVPSRPDRQLDAIVVAILLLFALAMIVSTTWFLVITARNRLFRWNKP